MKIKSLSKIMAEQHQDSKKSFGSDGSQEVDFNWSALNVFRKQPAVEPEISVAPNPKAHIYARCPNKGLAVIFNHKNFSIPKASTRDGTDKDRDDLKRLLKFLKFEVVVHDDLKCYQIFDVLDKVSRIDHTLNECLMVFVMSHGDNDKLFAADKAYDTKKLWQRFSADFCSSLAGKPKLFFIQACRGNQTDPGITVCFNETDTSTEDYKFYSIPVMADFLVMYSTVEGYFSWRDPKNGSYFIQSLVRQIEKYKEEEDLVSILTRVNREVAIGFTSYEPNQPEFQGKKEMCSIVSMLTRLFYF